MLCAIILPLVVYTACIPLKVMCVYTKVARINMMKKLYAMSKELVVDALAKVREAVKYKKQYQYSPAYQVGEVSCQALKKYDSMLAIYARSIQFYDDLNTTELMDKMIAMQNLYSDAHNLIRMIEIWYNGDKLLYRASNDGDSKVENMDTSIKFLRYNSLKKQSTYARKKNHWIPQHKLHNSNEGVKNNPPRIDYAEEGFDTDTGN